MAGPTFALLDCIRKFGAHLNGDFLRERMQLLTQILIELEAKDKICAGKDERWANRKAHRWSCPVLVDTRRLGVIAYG